jgi:hypothetical protein
MRKVMVATIVGLLAASPAMAGGSQSAAVTTGGFNFESHGEALGALWMRVGNQINNYYYAAGFDTPKKDKVTCTAVGTSILCK